MMRLVQPVGVTQPRFSGDVRELMRYQTPGITNKQPLFDHDLFVSRPDVDEHALYAMVTDRRHNRPVLITGKARSGKSIIALRLMQRLERAGHMVMCIENKMYPAIQFMKPEDIQKLQETLTLVDSAPLYVFVDEPHIIPVMEHRLGSIAARGGTPSTVAQLAALVKRYPNLKLIGIKASGIEPWMSKNTTPELAGELDDLFPVSHHVVIPPVSSLAPDLTIQMANSGLKTAGFLPLPQQAMASIKRIATIEPLDIRVMMGVLAAIIGQIGCNGDKTQPEPFPVDGLEALPEMLLYNLRKHRL